VLQRVVRIHDGHVIGEAFDDLMGMLDGPVFVVTTQADGRPSGCLVGFATQTSVLPPSFMVGLPSNADTAEVASRSEHLAVHVLAQRQHVLAGLFANQTDEEIDPFMRCRWRAGPYGMPILDDAVAWFVGRTASRSEVGDYVAYLLEPVSVWAPECTEDLLYLSDLDFEVDDIDPGQEAAQQRFYNRERGEETRRYGGVRFTLDVP
jgi:flavin reductase (DIM6/NTAB) family NADH-FMN oxidoreductase RutF